MDVGSIKWLFSRLLAMSPGEVLHRFRHKAQQRRYERKYPTSRSILELGGSEISAQQLVLLRERMRCVFDIESLSCPKSPFSYRCFSREIDLRQPISWHGFEAVPFSRTSTSWKIPLRDTDEQGEVRQIWELSRMQFLPALVLYSRKKDDGCAYDLAKAIFYDWHRENPFLRGVNWASPMEIALRAWQWVVCYAILDGAGDEAFALDLLRAAMRSFDYVCKNRSAYSSANNHLILEVALTVLAGDLLGDVWEENLAQESRSILSRELTRQFYSDGVNREHALHYHAFVTDVWLQVNLLSRALGKASLHDGLLEKALAHVEATHLGGGFYVEYGDSDNAVILTPTGGEIPYYDYLLALGNRYFSKIQDASALATMWRIPEEVPSAQGGAPQDFFEHAGYYSYRSAQLYLLFDVAELGFGELAAHGHADCLQTVIGWEGRPVFIDSGTFVYNIKSSRRNEYRSTPAHNTLHVQGRSQSSMRGPFLWSKKAHVIEKGRREDGRFSRVFGAHDGYSPQIHRREVVIERDTGATAIADDFTGTFTLQFILHPDRKVTKLHENLYGIDDNLVFYSMGEITLVKRMVSFAFLEERQSLAFEVKGNSRVVSVLAGSREAAEAVSSQIVW